MKYLMGLVFASGLLFATGVTFADLGCIDSTIDQCTGFVNVALPDVSVDTVVKT